MFRLEEHQCGRLVVDDDDDDDDDFPTMKTCCCDRRGDQTITRRTIMTYKTVLVTWSVAVLSELANLNPCLSRSLSACVCVLACVCPHSLSLSLSLVLRLSWSFSCIPLVSSFKISFLLSTLDDNRISILVLTPQVACASNCCFVVRVCRDCCSCFRQESCY